MYSMLEKLQVITRYRVLLAIVSLILIILFGGIGFWLYKSQKSSLDYAVTNINKALEEDNLVLLSNYVDFDSLSKNFVHSILQYWSSFRIDESRQKELEDNVQQIILLALRHNDKNQGNNITSDSSITSIQTIDQKMPFSFLPKDFLKQLKEKKFTIYRQDEDIAILKTSIVHNEAEYHTELSLLVQRVAGKWHITKIINADELVKLHMAKKKKKEDQLTHEVAVRNDYIRNEMNKYYHVSECNAFVIKKENSNDEDVPLTISVGGINMGSEVLRSAGMRCFLYDIHKNILAVLPLTMAKNVSPGDFFEQEWYMEIPENVLGHSFLLMKDNTISCAIEVTTVILADGTFLYLTPTPEKERLHP